MAQAFDAAGRKLAADAVPVAARVTTEGSRYVSASVSDTGTLLYAPEGSLNSLQLTWFDRAGKILGNLGDGAGEGGPALSPDQRHVALSLASGTPANVDIWTVEIARNLRSRVTSDGEPESWPVWSPNGTHIVFGSGALGGRGARERPARLLLTLSNGTGGAKPSSKRRHSRTAMRSPTVCVCADRLVRRRSLSCCTRSAGRFRRRRTYGPCRSLETANRFQ